MSTTGYLDRKEKMLCGIEPSQVAGMIDDLMDAEIGGKIDVVGVDEALRLHHPPEECGFSCEVNQVALAIGNELDEYEWENEQLGLGHAIVAVPAPTDELQEKVRLIMTEHCQTALHFHGKWTTKSL